MVCSIKKKTISSQFLPGITKNCDFAITLKPFNYSLNNLQLFILVYGTVIFFLLFFFFYFILFLFIIVFDAIYMLLPLYVLCSKIAIKKILFYSQVSRDFARFPVFLFQLLVENLLVCGVIVAHHTL